MTQEIDSGESSTASGTTGPGGDVDVNADADDGIAAKLAAEIEAGEARDEDLAVVQKAIGGRLSRSIMTQLRHLQSRVSELDAYTDAFASFLDEEGTGRQIVDEMQDEIDAVKSGLDDVRDDVDATDGRLDDTRSALDDTAGELGELSEDVRGLEERLAAVTERHDDAIERLEGAVERIEGTLDEETDDLEATIDAVRSDLDELEDGVDDLISWRDQLGEMFSGKGGD